MNLPRAVSRDEWVAARKRLLNSTVNYLDLTAFGRQEPREEPPGRGKPPDQRLVVAVA